MPEIKSVYKPREYRSPHGAGIFVFGPLLGIGCWALIAAAVVGIAMLAGWLDWGPM